MRDVAGELRVAMKELRVVAGEFWRVAMKDVRASRREAVTARLHEVLHYFMRFCTSSRGKTTSSQPRCTSSRSRVKSSIPNCKSSKAESSCPHRIARRHRAQACRQGLRARLHEFLRVVVTYKHVVTPSMHVFMKFCKSSSPTSTSSRLQCTSS